MIAYSSEFRKKMFLYFCKHNKGLMNESFNKPKSLIKKIQKICKNKSWKKKLNHKDTNKS